MSSSFSKIGIIVQHIITSHIGLQPNSKVCFWIIVVCLWFSFPIFTYLNKITFISPKQQFLGISYSNIWLGEMSLISWSGMWFCWKIFQFTFLNRTHIFDINLLYWGIFIEFPKKSLHRHLIYIHITKKSCKNPSQNTGSVCSPKQVVFSPWVAEGAYNILGWSNIHFGFFSIK